MIRENHGFFSDFLAQKPALIEVSVKAALGQETLVVAAFDDLAVVDHDDLVGILDG